MNLEPRRNIYIGHRYVPKIMGEWSKENTYEGLSIVTFEGDSYTSKQHVPVGIDIKNEEYWVVTGNYNAQIEYYRKETESAIQASEKNADDINTINSDIDKINNEIEKIEGDTLTRGVNALYPPDNYTALKGDGVTNDTQALKGLINNFDEIILPINREYCVDDTIFIPRNKKLIGVSSPSGSTYTDVNNSGVATIKYIGEKNNKKSVVVVGYNNVGEEPLVDASGIVFKSVVVDCNYKAGFGVYGTYLTNETDISHLVVRKSLEHACYFARGWYASITNITAKNNKGCGVTLGMPLTYQNGDRDVFTTPNALELNNVIINNIRSISSGEHFSVDNPGTFDCTDNNINHLGYGIGAGVGNAFDLSSFVSEKSGGVNMYVYTDSQPNKKISKGYMEKSCLNGKQTTDTTRCNMIIEHVSDTGGSYTIEDIFMNYQSGGIYYKGTKTRKVWLKNIHQPRFLKSLNGLESHELYAIVLKDNVYFDCGYTNTNIEGATVLSRETINTRYSWEIIPNSFPVGFIQVYAKLKNASDTQPIGSIAYSYEDGSYKTMSFKTLTTDYVYIGQFSSKDLVKIYKGGLGGDIDANIDIKLVAQKFTYV